MREYETIFVLRPDSAETQTKALLERLDTMVERHGGTILQQKNWGKKELAYRVQKQNYGVYYYYNYSGDNNLVSDLEKTLRYNELAMKFLTVKLADAVDVDTRKKQIEDLAAKQAASAAAAVTLKADEVAADSDEENEEVIDE